MILVGRKSGLFQPKDSKEQFPWVNLAFMSEGKNIDGSWPSILKVATEFQDEAKELIIGEEYEPMFNSYGKIVSVR
jgi:hypothetical protein